MTAANSEPYQTSKMKHFARLVNDFAWVLDTHNQEKDLPVKDSSSQPALENKKLKNLLCN